MAYKSFPLDGLGDVKIYKRKGNRSLRLSVTASGEVRVSIPTWAPYQAGLTFVQSRYEWVKAQLPARGILQPGQAIGKAHRLIFEPNPTSAKPSSRIRQTEIVITYPSQLTTSDSVVQQLAQTASIRALRRQAEQLLPQRLKQLAEQHGFSYHSVSIKQLKGRWGSCDHHQNIVLNLFLMQLPWEYIDYVLLHELTHTQVLRHGPPFWEAMARVLPNVQAVRKHMRTYQPILAVQAPLAVS